MTTGLNIPDFSKAETRETLTEFLDLSEAAILLCHDNRPGHDLLGNGFRQYFSDAELEILSQQGLFPFVNEEDRDDTSNAWELCQREDKTFHRTIRLQTESTPLIWARLTSKKHTTGHLIFIQDVTVNLNVQDDLLKKNEIATKNLQQKSLTLAKLSHEIRTPMNAVMGIADALLHHEANEAIKPRLELILSSAQGILKILDSNLSLAKIEANKIELDYQPANPRQVLQNICELWTPQAHKSGTLINSMISVDVPESIVFDRFRFEQCLNNLLSNAVKFTEHGRIDVVMTLVSKDGEDTLVVAVRDTGIGMSKEQLARIFDAFSQGDKTISSRYGGTGLGMHITRQLVELMGGNLRVKSTPNEGTTFAMSIPLLHRQDKPRPAETADEEDTIALETVQAAAEESLEEAPELNGLTVMVADDNPTNHVVVKALLENYPIDIVTADDGQQVLDILETRHVDIILMDIHMPVMDGLECTLAIRDSGKPWADVKIIALTADPQFQQKRICLNLGMQDALAKPVKREEIVRSFQQVLEESQLPMGLKQAV